MPTVVILWTSWPGVTGERGLAEAGYQGCGTYDISQTCAVTRCRGEKIVVELFYLLVLLLLSGVFSGSETALVALSIGRVEGLVREGRHGATALYQLKKDPSRMLTTILIGNNLVNIAASVMATVIATRAFGSAGPGIAVGVLTILILVFGEITPKSLATRYLSLIHISEPTRPNAPSRMPSSA